MKVTFPYMGTTLIYTKLFEMLGHEVIVPIKPNKETIDLGVKYSPEFACFPLKVLMGTYLQSIKRGAETVITSGGHGPCRAGYYGEVHKKTLEHMGKDIDFIVFDEPSRGYRAFFDKIKRVKGNTSWPGAAKIIKTIYQMAHSLDKLEKYLTSRRAYVKDFIGFNKAWEEIQNKYLGIENSGDIKLLEKEALETMKNFEAVIPPEKERIRIGIIGEIYVVMEPSVNNNIEEILNEFGVEVERSQYISEWIDENLIPFKNKKTKEIMKK
ncbi:MAG TPA: hypothetical protein VKY40_05960, partial [Halanaerobiales bacterium]|nr:hypothetical protein [Halanaerobiales bacterium]